MRGLFPNHYKLLRKIRKLTGQSCGNIIINNGAPRPNSISSLVIYCPHSINQIIWWAGRIRDLTFPWMYQIPYFRKEMAITISGLKTGMFQQIQYDEIAKQ